MPRIDYTKQAFCRQCQKGYNFENITAPPAHCPKGHWVRLKPRHPSPRTIENLKRY